jgi:hypothetical protein
MDEIHQSFPLLLFSHVLQPASVPASLSSPVPELNMGHYVCHAFEPLCPWWLTKITIKQRRVLAFFPRLLNALVAVFHMFIQVMLVGEIWSIQM